MLRLSILIVVLSAPLAHAQALLSIGETIIDSRNNVGVVKGSKNLDVIYRKNNEHYDSAISIYLISEKVDSPQFPAGAFAVDENNNVGQIVNAFEDGRVEYRRNTYGNNVSRDLSPEVVGHEKYDKGIEYASSSHEISEVVRFFSNGKIELASNRGAACDKAYEAVDELDWVKQGTEVMQPVGSVVVEKIFANNTAKVRVEDRESAVQILTFQDIQRPQLRKQWLQELSQLLNNPEMKQVPTLAIRKGNYKSLVELLKKDLENSGRKLMTRENAKKVLKHLEEKL